MDEFIKIIKELREVRKNKCRYTKCEMNQRNINGNNNRNEKFANYYIKL